MKKNILLYMAAVAGLVLAGCNKEIVPPQEGSLDMTVTASIGDLTKVAYDGASTTFQTGDQIAVWAWTGASDVLPQTFVVDGIVNTLDESGKWVPASQMLWKNVHDKHYFMAVHPVPTTAIADFSAVPYAVDNTNYEASDLLLANELTGLTAEAKTVDLTFSHVMAKLQVNLKFRNQFGPDGPAPASVTAALVGKATATVNYLTKAVTPTGDEASVTMAPIAKAEGYAMSFSGIQIPQEATKIVVTVGEKSFSYTHPAALPIEPGKVTALGFNVGQDMITLESVTVNPWVSDEPLAGGEAERCLTIDLAELNSDYVAQDGETLVGTLGANVKVSIAAGATVTLGGMSINRESDMKYPWAGITCNGDATIILKDGTTNEVTGFYYDRPGIWIQPDYTLTIKGEKEGTGKLTAGKTFGYAAGIGAVNGFGCGNITILGGDITAIGGGGSAGIGGSGSSSCGYILIAGGTVSATGGNGAPGIGGGWGEADYPSSCGTITITSSVTRLTATKGGSEVTRSIGAGIEGTCGMVTIAGKEYPDGITVSQYIYPNPIYNITAEDVGKIIGADNNIYATVTDALNAGTAARAMIAYVGADSDCEHGLAIAIGDVSSDEFKWAVAADKVASWAVNVPVAGGTWRLPSLKDWEYMLIGCGASGSYNPAPTYISTEKLKEKLFKAAGGTNFEGNYWSSTDDGDSASAWLLNVDATSENFFFASKTANENRVRACFAF